MRARSLTLLGLFLLLASTAFSGPGSIRTITHSSEALGREQSYTVYVPEAAVPGEGRWPVLYVLHGAYGSHGDWVAGTDVEELAEAYRMILVFPDGGQFGWYVDAPNDPGSQYETYITRDLIADVDSRFPTVAAREGRAIMGLSMGGHGALLLAAKHPELFSSASSLSGILQITNHPEKWGIADRLGPMSENRALWEANSVVEQAARFKDENVRLLFDCGIEDTAAAQTGALEDGRALHAALKELGVAHVWREHTGGHTWEYWGGHLQSHLNFHQASMIGAVPGDDRWFRLYFDRLRLFADENAALTLAPPGDEEMTVCLLGSSSMQGFPKDMLGEYRIFNRGISADRLGTTSRGISHRMELSVFDMRPRIVFLKNGRNDLGARHSGGNPTIPRMLEEYEEIVGAIQGRLPGTKIVVMTSFPTRDRYEHLRDAIVEWNTALREMTERRGVILIDSHPLLSEEDGRTLRAEFSSDGLHLTRAGYAVIEPAMRQIIEEVQAGRR